MATSIGIVDYSVGNHGSLVTSLRRMGLRVFVSQKPEELDLADVIMLPGVGAFPAAMQSLSQLGLDDYLRLEAAQDKPIIGICLGMQLLADISYEHKSEKGLGIISGEIKPFEAGKWHIGWNEVKFKKDLLKSTEPKDRTFYFNHAFCYEGPEIFKMAKTHDENSITAVIRNKKTVGIQFHPEKSQMAGSNLLRNLIDELMNA